MEAELSRLRYPFFWRRFEGVVNHYDDMCLRLYQSQNISVTTHDLHELIHIFGAGVGDGQQLGEVIHLPAQRHHEARHYPRCPVSPYLQAVVLASHSGAVQGSPSPRHRRTRTACTKLWSPGPGPAAGRLITNLEQR